MNLPKIVHEYTQQQQQLHQQMQQQQQQQVKLKINNSYESEPSSGSGSSISENNDCNVSDDENLCIPFTRNLQPKHAAAAGALSTLIVVHSSQESPFHGFGDSPFDKINQIMSTSIKNKNLNDSSKTKPLLNTSDASSFAGFASASDVDEEMQEQQQQNNPVSTQCGKVTFPRFYDLLLENSCNAVDMKLPGVASNVETIAKVDNATKHNTSAEQELSFNGKIKNLTATSENSANTQVQSEAPADVRIYNNVYSPDLFDDDEDSSNDEDNEKETIKPVELPAAKGTLPKESQNSKSPMKKHLKMQNMLHWNLQCEREFLRRTRKCLSGVPPPPSMTIPQVSMFDEIVKRKTEILNFLAEIARCQPTKEAYNDSNTIRSRQIISLLKPTHTIEETKATAWKDILAVRQQGLW